MEQRRYERKPFHLKAELIAGEVSYVCYVENLSEYGVYVEIEPSNIPVEFYPVPLYFATDAISVAFIKIHDHQTLSSFFYAHTSTLLLF